MHTYLSMHADMFMHRHVHTHMHALSFFTLQSGGSYLVIHKQTHFSSL